MNRHQNLEIAVLNQISQAVMREKNVTALLRWVLEILYREMGLLRGTVTLRRGDQLFIEASHGLSDAEIRRGKYRPANRNSSTAPAPADATPTSLSSACRSSTATR